MKSFVALDFETANQHRSSVCSIGLVFVENLKIIDSFYELIKPTPNFYCNWATDIHGIQYWDTINSFEFPEIWKHIAKEIKEIQKSISRITKPPITYGFGTFGI